MLYRFLCIRKEKINSPVAAKLRGAIDPSPSDGDSPSELIQLCSGQFPATPSPHGLTDNRKGCGTQAVRELLGFDTQLEPRMGMSQATQDDVIGFCSGAFPSSQAHISAGHTSSWPSRAETSDGMSSDTSSEGEGEEMGVAEEGGVLMRWVQQHHQMLSQQDSSKVIAEPGVGVVKSWAGYESDNEMGGMDEDMPFIRRRKVKVRQSNG